jgi:hypothetical protein
MENVCISQLNLEVMLPSVRMYRRISQRNYSHSWIGNSFDTAEHLAMYFDKDAGNMAHVMYN